MNAPEEPIDENSRAIMLSSDSGPTQLEARVHAEMSENFGKPEVTPNATKTRYRVGQRYTYDPNRDAKLGIKSTRPDPNGPNAEYWPNGALKGTRTVGCKIIRRMFRRVARTYGSRTGRKILEAQQLHAKADEASCNTYEAKRTLDAQIAADRKERGPSTFDPRTRSDFRATGVPGRGARKRALERLAREAAADRDTGRFADDGQREDEVQS